MNNLTTQFTLAALATSVTATNLMESKLYTMGDGGVQSYGSIFDDLLSTTTTTTKTVKKCTWKDGDWECTDGGTSTE